LFSDITTKTLGKGGEGTVFVAKHKDTSNEYAMKEIFVNNSKDADKVKNTVEKIRRLSSSPYVVKYYSPVESSQYIYILMEYCRGFILQEFIEKTPANKAHEEVVFFFFFFLIQNCSRIFFPCSTIFFSA
jgi:serine/threonine protein kinase